MNLWGHLAEFLGVKELLQLTKNKQKRKNEVEKSKLFTKYVELYSKWNISINSFDFYYSPLAIYIEAYLPSLLGKFSRNKIAHLIQQVIHYASKFKQTLIIDSDLNREFKYLER